MKIYCTTSSNRIQSGSIAEFIEPFPARGISIGDQVKVVDTQGKWAWIWVPAANGGKSKPFPVQISKLKLVPQPKKDLLTPFIGLSGKYIDAQKDVVSKYNVDIDPDSHCQSRMHAHVKERRVCKYRPKNSAQATFDLFHEIGHIETTKSWMRRCEEEYYATVWAIERCKEYGIEIPMKTIKEYQEYIDDELARGKRRGGTDYNIDLNLYKYI